MVHFYNSLSRALEAFKPASDERVTYYSCGPTVYNYAHIGNLRAYLFNDIVKRYLEFRGYSVHHVMNITDVDDKTIRDSQKAGKTLREFTDFYLAEFLEDLKTLNIILPEKMPRATDEIDGMIEMIGKLLESGHAYQAENGDVYFKVSSFPNYGELVQLNPETLKANAGQRLNAADEYEKENAQDFALWKAHSAADGDNYWESPFGRGRPGWHLECSVMSTKYLGQPIDIHSGGVDLKFPHHTNEIAQSECCGAAPFVRYWLHNEHLIVNGKKMAKSAGNFFTLRDLLERGHDPRSIRYELLLKTHYRQQLDFREDDLSGNTKLIQRFDDCYEKLSESAPAETPLREEWNQFCRGIESEFCAAMDDDLNISVAMAAVMKFIKEVNKSAQELTAGDRQLGRELLKSIDSVFGLGIGEQVKELPDEEIQALIDEREEARKSKNFARADEIRDHLAGLGVILKDTASGVRFTRKP